MKKGFEDRLYTDDTFAGLDQRTLDELFANLHKHNKRIQHNEKSSYNVIGEEEVESDGSRRLTVGGGLASRAPETLE